MQFEAAARRADLAARARRTPFRQTDTGWKVGFKQRSIVSVCCGVHVLPTSCLRAEPGLLMEDSRHDYGVNLWQPPYTLISVLLWPAAGTQNAPWRAPPTRRAQPARWECVAAALIRKLGRIVKAGARTACRIIHRYAASVAQLQDIGHVVTHIPWPFRQAWQGGRVRNLAVHVGISNMQLLMRREG